MASAHTQYRQSFAIHDQFMGIPSIGDIESMYGGCGILFEDCDVYPNPVVHIVSSDEESSEVSNSDLDDWHLDYDADEQGWDSTHSDDFSSSSESITTEYASFCEYQAHAVLSESFSIARSVLQTTMAEVTRSTPGELIMNVQQVLDHIKASFEACQHILTMKDAPTTKEEDQFSDYLQQSIDNLETAVAADCVGKIVTNLNAVHHCMTLCAASTAFADQTAL